jgi:hypothetical protein
MCIKLHEFAWPLQENVHINVHTLMQIVHNFWADLNVKIKHFPSTQHIY